MSDSIKQWEESRTDEWSPIHQIKRGKIIKYKRDDISLYSSQKTNTNSFFDRQIQEKESMERLKKSVEELEGKKESEGKLNYELDWNFIEAIAERMISNKDKYEPYNWKKRTNLEGIKQALFRHVIEVMKGNYEDDGRLFGHLEAIAINSMILYFQKNECNL